MLFSISCFCSSAEQTQKELLTICIGQASSSAKNIKLDTFMAELFETTNLNPKLFFSPAKRAEYLFKVGKCGGFFVSSSDFPTQIDRYDIVYVPEPIMNVDVDAFVLKEGVCSAEHSCLSSLVKSQVLGVFRSHALFKYLQTKTRASIVEITLLDQGVKMLEQSRLDVLVIPNVIIETRGLSKVESVASVELYLWLDKKHAPYVNEISSQIRRLKTEPLWKSIFHTNNSS
ncbi:hypothetical protein [Thalassotalea euphylliae]|nr:hypothetical protein [Thalassotalea euphylliae]